MHVRVDRRECVYNHAHMNVCIHIRARVFAYVTNMSGEALLVRDEFVLHHSNVRLRLESLSFTQSNSVTFIEACGYNMYTESRFVSNYYIYLIYGDMLKGYLIHYSMSLSLILRAVSTL